MLRGMIRDKVKESKRVNVGVSAGKPVHKSSVLSASEAKVKEDTVIKEGTAKKEDATIKDESVTKENAGVKDVMVTREDPKENQIYKHFKGNLYKILTIAIHSETREKMVVYKPLYDCNDNYVRPLDMFMSEVDHIKYPKVTQKYRFELVDGEPEDTAEQVVEEENAEAEGTVETDTNESLEQTAEEKPAETATDEDEQLHLDPKLEKFLDAGSYKEKLECFYGMKKTATKEILSYVAMSLDIELSKDDIDEQYSEILYCLKTMEKYECNRLRP